MKEFETLKKDRLALISLVGSILFLTWLLFVHTQIVTVNAYTPNVETELSDLSNIDINDIRSSFDMWLGIIFHETVFVFGLVMLILRVAGAFIKGHREE